MLHHNYVVALLNDLFGIQARGGCSCAGPYGHRLLGIDQPSPKSSSEKSSAAARESRPAACVNFNYFISEAVADFIIEAVHLVANEGCSFPSMVQPMTGQGSTAAA